MSDHLTSKKRPTLWHDSIAGLGPLGATEEPTAQMRADGLYVSLEDYEKLQTLLLRWQGAMRFSGVAALAESEPDANPVAQLIRDTDAVL